MSRNVDYVNEFPEDESDATALTDYSGDQASRPSKTNCKTTPESEASWRKQWWREKNELVDQFVDEYPERASRPVSVRGGELLREECTLPKHNDDRHRSASWSSILNEFLKWYNGYRHAHLVFDDPDGNTVRSQMQNAHQPRYGDRYYARIKALERQILRKYDNPHVAMLTFTGSMENAVGGWRCPCDHLRDVINSFRPDDGSGVYHALRYALQDYDWEYALVVEKHQSGYGHVHCAVFVDGEVEESDFHTAIDAHLRECDIAHRDAHDYYAEDESTRPISVNGVDPDVGPNQDDVEDITNLGSYIGEYIGAHGEALFDRSIEELAFRAAVWATSTQLVRFSTGANEMIDSEFVDRSAETEDTGPVVVQKHNFEPEAENPEETVDGSPFEVIEGDWSIQGVARIDEDGETVYDMHQSGVDYVEIADAQHLDPPNQQPSDTPTVKSRKSTIHDY